MKNLDNLQSIKKLDPGKVLDSIEMLGEQINQTWQEFKQFSLSKSYKQVDNVLINGMGGSALGPHLLYSLFSEQLKVPFRVINSYQLPASLNKKTLYIVSSYSGNTEEPLETIAEAKKRGAKIFGISSGGKLAKMIKQKKIPGYVFEPTFNPSDQPRMGLGYSLAAHIALFKKLGLIKVSNNEIKNILILIDKLQSQFGVYKASKNNLAKKMAKDLVGKIPIIVSSGFLSANSHVFTNQINENAKNFANYFLISELNHHLLEGLSFPKANRQFLMFVFFESKLYYSKNQIRHKITKKVLTKNRIKSLSYSLKSNTKILQAMEMLIFGSYVSFYLAILNNINPSKIPWVDYFKAELKKAS